MHPNACHGTCVRNTDTVQLGESPAGSKHVVIESAASQPTYSSLVGQDISTTAPVCMYLLLKLYVNSPEDVSGMFSLVVYSCTCSAQAASTAYIVLPCVQLVGQKHPPHNGTCPAQFEDPAPECPGLTSSSSGGCQGQSLRTHRCSQHCGSMLQI